MISIRNRAWQAEHKRPADSIFRGIRPSGRFRGGSFFARIEDRGPQGLRSWAWLVCFATLLWSGTARAQTKPSPDYAAVHSLLAKHCLDCHAAQDPEGKLVLESFDTLMKGGASGLALVPGKSSDSLLIHMLEGAIERAGKRVIMPPGRRAKLTAEEIALVRAWIDAGAQPAAPGTAPVLTVAVPKIHPRVTPRRPIQTVAYAPGPKLVAVGRYGEVELVSAESQSVLRTLTGQRGAVNALAFSAEGDFLFAGGGEAGMSGEVQQWSVGDGRLIRTFGGHKDALYALALSPDGQTLATGGYDQKIKIWNVADGTEIRTLSGHNGCISDLAFRPDGRILASASADRTVKLWDVASGERRDTFSQSLKEVNTLTFSPDGSRLYAGGGDNRIRIWEISEKALETTNPLLEARFAHEGALLKMAFSPDGAVLLSSGSDQTLKLWDASNLQEKLVLERQSDWAPAAAFVLSGTALVAGRLDGTLQFYEAASGSRLAPPKPQLARSQPRGVRRGTTTRMQLFGTNLSGLDGVVFSDSRIQATVIKAQGTTAGEAWIEVQTPPTLPRGSYEFSVRTPNGETSKIKLHVDDLPQVYVEHGAERMVVRPLEVLPASVWAAHERAGDTEEYAIAAGAGQSLVFEVSAKRLGSKADVLLTLSDPEGRVLASRSGFGNADPVMAFAFEAAGQYKLRVSDLVLGASVDHYYRLSVGALPFVTACFPLSVPAGRETDVQLIGYNLPAGAAVKVHAYQPGDVGLPLDPERFRAQREFKLIASALTELVEAEPNDTVEQGTELVPPCSMGGRIWSSTGTGDVDYYRFPARAGQRWVIETAAARLGSPLDTKIEVLHADGRPVERLQLQAVRDSAVTFRGIDSDTTDCRVVNWEEMELNQYLYLQGEVLKLFRAPQGPDSGFLFYNANGRRRCFFDTSPSAHAVDEPAYIVEPRPPGTKVASNGLPVFPLYFANDDDGERKLGTDSKLQFTAPADGTYLVRVTDTRAQSGDRFAYRLVLRPVEPDFAVKLAASNLSVNAGSGQEFDVDVERFDGFEGEISVTINHLPAGFSVSSPLLIEAGHRQASATIRAAPDAPKPADADWDKVEVTASALVEGRAFVKAVNHFGRVRLADKPKLLVYFEPDASDPNLVKAAAQVAAGSASPEQRPLELTIAPGQTIPALLRVQRNGHDDLITFTVENLPHGVIVDNIGLNGVLIPKDQNERQIFLTAAKWVPDSDRLCYAVEQQAGRQTSRPVLLHVRRNAGLQAAAPR